MITSPLRYPGGKARLYPLFARIIADNGLFDTHYCEPYAGGAGLAIRLLTNGFVSRIKLNDIDPAISAFWESALLDSDRFCELIESTPLSIDEWHRQQGVWKRGNRQDPLALGFATYYLNRTNRSGIIEGAGPIGGYAQSGDWKLGVRLVKDKQIDNLRRLSKFSSQIDLYSKDAAKFFSDMISEDNTFIYLDPPYYVKGRKLYKNFYNHEDHEFISKILIRNREKKWIVSYDDVPQIRLLYNDLTPISYSLNYSAGAKGIGKEVMYFSNGVVPPKELSQNSAA